jgi:chromosomal replication initiator protein
VPSQFFYEWLEEHYVSLLKKIIKRELGTEGRLEYRIVVENSSQNNNPYTINVPTYQNEKSKNPSVAIPLNISSSIKNPFVIPGLKQVNIDPQLNPNYTFDSFVEGECNQLARSAGFAVATKPGTNSFNPLVIYGGTGLGKTHLAQAIGNQIKQIHNNKTVLYVQSEKFTNQFIEAVKNNSTNDFIAFYQMIDVLIIDDIQFFENKERTQDILFHIFNHLHQSGKQLVLTSDRPPRDLNGIEERLLSRFKWGLTTDIQQADFETRIAILEKKMYNDGIELSKEIVEFIAYNITNNVRELEGALISLLAHASLNKKSIDLSLAKQIVKNFVKNISREISIDYIQKTVCEYFTIPIELLKAKTRKREVVQARQLSMFLAKHHTKNSLKSIGQFFGGRDHSTVIHSCQAIQNLMDTDKKFKKSVEDIEKKIKMSTA